MGAKGNQFWKIRSKHGRDKLFATPEILWEAACEYFEWCDENPWIKTDFRGKDVETVYIPTQRPYTLIGLCLYLGTNEAYFRQFRAALAKDENDFSTVITRIEDVIRTNKYEGAVVGAFNALIISRDLGLMDKVETNNEHNITITRRIVGNADNNK